MYIPRSINKNTYTRGEQPTRALVNQTSRRKLAISIGPIISRIFSRPRVRPALHAQPLPRSRLFITPIYRDRVPVYAVSPIIRRRNLSRSGHVARKIGQIRSLSAKARLRVLLGPRRRTFLTHERALSSAGEGEARREREREAANCARATLKDLTEKIGSDLSKRWRDGRVKLDRARVPRVYATDRRAGPHL